MKLKTAKQHKDIWHKKPVLRYLYSKWYNKIIMQINDRPSGTIVEIGSGCGNIKNFIPEALATDIQNMPWLNLINSAENLPYKNNSLSTISMIDVFHHLSDPIQFINESYRTLKKSGYLVIIEPYPTFFSNIFYQYFHNEPLLKKQSLLITNTNYTHPNQAAAFILFNKEKNEFLKKYEGKFTLIHFSLFSFLLYPLSGGYRAFNFIPKILIKPISLVENLFSPIIKYIAFRSIIVLRKK